MCVQGRSVCVCLCVRRRAVCVKGRTLCVACACGRRRTVVAEFSSARAHQGGAAS